MYRLIVKEEKMDASQLYSAVVACGDIVEAPEVIPNIVHAQVYAHKGMIYMSGITGKHALNIQYTDKERLHAHWAGFKERNDAEARKMFP